MENFPSFTFFKIGQENVFDDTQGRKKAFPNYKNKELNKSKNGDFSKGLVHGFGQKVEIFICFFLAKQARKMCLTIL